MHLTLGNPDTSDSTYMYLVTGVVVLIVFLVFVVLMKKPWTRFRVKHKDTEIDIGNEPPSGPSGPDASGQSSGPNSPGAVIGPVTYNQQKGLTEKTVNRIIDQADKIDRLRTENVSLRQQLKEAQSEAEKLKSKQIVTEAVERVEDEAEKGDQQAIAAIEEARTSGDTQKLQAALIAVADRQAKKIRDDMADHIRLCREIAEIAYLRGDFDEAMRRLEVIRKADPQDLDAINRLGHIYILRNQLDKAEQAYIRISELSFNNLEGQMVSHGNLSTIYKLNGKLDQATQSALKALSLGKQLNQPEGIALAYGNLGAIYFDSREYDQAKQMISKSIEINKQLPRIENLAINYSNLGCIHLECGDLVQAEKVIMLSLEINEKLSRLVGIARDFGNLGQIAKARGDKPKARELWTQSRDLFTQMRMSHMAEKVQGWLDGLPDEPEA